MKEKLYSIAEACQLFGVPRSVLTNGVIYGAVPTTLKFDTEGNRCRHKHFVTEKEVRAFYQEYLVEKETRETVSEESPARKYRRTVDTYNLEARHKLEDLALLKELAGYGVCAEDLM